MKYLRVILIRIQNNSSKTRLKRAVAKLAHSTAFTNKIDPCCRELRNQAFLIFPWSLEGRKIKVRNSYRSCKVSPCREHDEWQFHSKWNATELYYLMILHYFTPYFAEMTLRIILVANRTNEVNFFIQRQARAGYKTKVWWKHLFSIVKMYETHSEKVFNSSKTPWYIFSKHILKLKKVGLVIHLRRSIFEFRITKFGPLREPNVILHFIKHQLSHD